MNTTGSRGTLKAGHCEVERPKYSQRGEGSRWHLGQRVPGGGQAEQKQVTKESSPPCRERAVVDRQEGALPIKSLTCVWITI